MQRRMNAVEIKPVRASSLEQAVWWRHGKVIGSGSGMHHFPDVLARMGIWQRPVSQQLWRTTLHHDPPRFRHVVDAGSELASSASGTRCQPPLSCTTDCSE
jgi:hypothetical protein